MSTLIGKVLDRLTDVQEFVGDINLKVDEVSNLITDTLDRVAEVLDAVSEKVAEAAEREAESGRLDAEDLTPVGMFEYLLKHSAPESTFNCPSVKDFLLDPNNYTHLVAAYDQVRARASKFGSHYMGPTAK